MPPLEAWEKVLVNYSKFAETIHGRVGCMICHGGDSSEQEMEAAHQGLVADPSEGNCDTCHSDIAQVNVTSLHTTLSGFISKLEARGGNLEEGSPLDQALNNHCMTCHTSCGQCHVSRPTTLGGGLISGHVFRGTPSTQYSCYGCHGARVGDEYLGKNVGIPADVHWVKGGMTCTGCHSQEIHGACELSADRYHNEASVSCDDCHQDVWTDTAGNPQHEQHLNDFTCQVCHSVEYKSCYNCHAYLGEEGKPTISSDPSTMGFKIGLNPLRSAQSPYKYVVLRHPPVIASTFDYYGENLLPDFDAMPTWKYATPHNIQLHTPQNESCNSCHGNIDLFLTEEDLSPAEKEANKDVIVPEIPSILPW